MSSVLFKTLYFFLDQIFLPPVSQMITSMNAGDTLFAVTRTVHCFHPEAKRNR